MKIPLIGVTPKYHLHYEKSVLNGKLVSIEHESAENVEVRYADIQHSSRYEHSVPFAERSQKLFPVVEMLDDVRCIQFGKCSIFKSREIDRVADMIDMRAGNRIDYLQAWRRDLAADMICRRRLLAASPVAMAPPEDSSPMTVIHASEKSPGR